jgi:hypothetical protein
VGIFVFSTRHSSLHAHKEDSLHSKAVALFLDVF